MAKILCFVLLSLCVATTHAQQRGRGQGGGQAAGGGGQGAGGQGNAGDEGVPADIESANRAITAQNKLDFGTCARYTDDGDIVEVLYDECIEYCCGGNVIRKDGRSSCCGTQELGSPYNPDTDRCCEWWTGYGMGYRKTRFRGHLTGCCGANLIHYGKQGCCYGYPDPPELFDLKFEMCCGSHRMKIPTQAKSQARCCGDKAAYDISKQSCPCEDGRLLDVTINSAGCCESSFGLKNPYNILTHFCCEGSVGEIGVDFCCGGSVGKVGQDMCCDDKLTAMDKPSKVTTECCAGVAYDPTAALCCEGTIVESKDPASEKCCGTKVYNDVVLICCDGKTLNIKKDGDTCCGRYAYFAGKGSFCCEGRVYFSDAVGGNACCGTKFYNSTEVLSLCCNGELIPSEGNDACCESTPFKSKEQVCCNGQVFDKTIGEDCCNGFPYPAANTEEYICCRDGPGGPFKNPQCCGGAAYDSKGSICCGDNLFTGMLHPGCCVDVGFDSATHTCCGSTVYPNPFSSRRTQCCGTIDPRPFDLINQKCCDGLILDLPKNMSRERAECCGFFDVFDPEISICCDGNIFDKTDGKESFRCCGKTSYNVRTQMCCENEMYGNPFITEFTYGEENTGCCADVVFDKTSQHCCDGVLEDSQFTQSGCCAGIEYDMEKSICCDNNLYLVSKKVPIKRAKCCGSKCMYEGPQTCCRERIYMRGEISDKTCVNF